MHFENSLVINVILDRTWGPSGQKYSHQTSGTTTSDTFSQGIHDKNEEAERFESGRVDQQIFRRP